MCTGMEIMMLAATAVQTVSQMSAAEDQQDELRLRGEQERDHQNFQAEQAEADAQAEREAGEVRATKVRKAGKSTQSEATAALAAGGVEVTAGTPVKIASEIVRNSEEDALNEMLYGSRKASRLDQDASISRQTGARAVAGGYRAGEQAYSAGMMNAAGSVLRGGAELIGPGWKKAATTRPSYDNLLATGGELA